MKLRDLPLDLLQSFVAFVESPNMVAAAESLRVSQPLLTKHLQTLEETAPETLFSFEGRKKICTRYGRALYEVVKKHLESLENEIQELNLQQSRPEKILLRIGARKEILERIVPKARFAGRLDFQPMSGAEVVRLLDEGKLEIGITQHALDSQSLVRKDFLRDQFQIMVPESWDLKSKKMPDVLTELINRPFLSYGKIEQVQAFLRHYELDQKLEAARTFPSWTTITEMVDKKQGWTVGPKSHAQTARSIRVFDIAEKAAPGTDFKIYYPRELSHHAWFQEVVKSLL